MATKSSLGDSKMPAYGRSQGKQAAKDLSRSGGSRCSQTW